MGSIISLKNVTFAYETVNETDNKRIILENITFDIKEGEFLCIVGKNGCGKSTLAHLFNALNLPVEGDVYVDGINTKDETKTLDIRKTVGMVFQNPDNQIIASVVEEDVAFGLENIGVPSEEIIKKVDESLKLLELEKYRKDSPNKLSGGQKQKVALAGVLAMKPKVIVLDEVTSMLDPYSRKEVLDKVHELSEKENITIILITHFMEEVVDCDRVILLDDKGIVYDGDPKGAFMDKERLRKCNLLLPNVVRIANGLREKGINIKEDTLRYEDLISQL
ncbi:MAG: energy-coupling factor transporter ATPase [Lachnospiraceae bacterium]|nr:energy-coupling factor transporter ATPase [Lachnospiraceae bacterium]